MTIPSTIIIIHILPQLHQYCHILYSERTRSQRYRFYSLLMESSSTLLKNIPWSLACSTAKKIRPIPSFLFFGQFFFLVQYDLPVCVYQILNIEWRIQHMRKLSNCSAILCLFLFSIILHSHKVGTDTHLSPTTSKRITWTFSSNPLPRFSSQIHTSGFRFST